MGAVPSAITPRVVAISTCGNEKKNQGISQNLTNKGVECVPELVGAVPSAITPRVVAISTCGNQKKQAGVGLISQNLTSKGGSRPAPKTISRKSYEKSTHRMRQHSRHP